MGFYSASQLIQDALRHDVSVFPIDIQKSTWENSIEEAPENNAYSWGIRLGFSRIKGLSPNVGERIELARPTTAFSSVSDLARRAQLTRSELKLLAAADALKNLSGNRYQASWKSLAIEPIRPLLTNPDHYIGKQANKYISAPSVQENVNIDYQTTGLTLRQHPMALLRNQSPFNRCKRYADLAALNSGRFVRVAGLVTGRQRPGTANGTIFLTLEDETGNTSVIVWKRTQEHFRKPLLTAKLLMIKGTVETDQNVTHVIAGALIDLSDQLAELGIRSRDFH